MTRKRHTEEQIIAVSEGCPGRGQRPGPVPEARDLGCDVL
jgi:hypothetical protein